MVEILKVAIVIFILNKLQLGKGNTDIREASFLDLTIKIKKRKFNFGLFDKINSFPLSIV